MGSITMTINADKTASISRSYLGVQGEQMTVDVTVAASLAALGYDAYIDFLTPDGKAYYRGPYDCSSTTFTFSLGAYDSILDKNGDTLWQFVLADTVAGVRTIMWAAITYKTEVLYSVCATSSAVTPYIPQMEWPETYPAFNITIDDAGEVVTATDVEEAIQEIATNVETCLKYTDNIYGFIRNLSNFVVATGTTPLQIEVPTIVEGEPDDPTVSTNSFLVPTGNYIAIVEGQITWESNATGQRYTSVSTSDGTYPIAATQCDATASSVTIQNVHGIAAVTTGQKISLYGWQNSGGNLNATAGTSLTFLKVILIKI